MIPMLPVFALSRLRMGIDGAGVTTLVCSLGCPLSCPMCINPQAKRRDTPVRRYAAAELMEELSIDSLYFAATGGGVTFGGGEPLLHAPFLAAFGAARPKDWRMNLETSLNVPEEALRAVLPFADLLIVDVKDMNPGIYRAYAGRDPALMRANLSILAKTCPERVWLRVPLIPGYNSPDDGDRSEAVLREMGFTRIERFRYVNRAQSALDSPSATLL